ncbi:hypothetical protein NliqN6_2029 [Naganishia liquefaciens]|uniref:PWI domain-containing protein n=1 Tax=Naganishia liquefaciens TaxID=104408 RepID=A0A8H3TR16_9TREE|nr:hypothetical protein NliqN6_2029 [Naganishia liquefaciens]
MYNGYPPQGYPPYMPPAAGTPQGFRPPMPGMPMPTLPPQQSYPGSPAPNPGFRPGMPPFAPSPYGVPPPQPGTGVSPNANGFRPAPGLGYNGGAGVGHPPGGGYGFDQGAMGLPRPPHMMPGMMPGMPGGPGMMGGMDGNPNFVKPAVKTTAVYIGGIPDGINDSILTGIIQACGPLHKLNRVTNASGKQAGFGFAEFEDPEVVLRCLKCLHGTELPDITPRGRQEGLKKTLVVKADEKTRAFLDEFEELNIRTDHDDELDGSAKARIGNIVRALHDPSADLAAIIGASAAPDVREEDKNTDLFVVPDHLKDLDASELPENQRSVVMGQIASFREASAKREAEKRKHDENLDVRKQAMMGASVPYGRAPYQAAPTAGRQWGNGTQPHSPQQQQQQQQSQTRPIGDGPQSYNQPVGFVKAQTAEAKAETERTDEEAEQIKMEEQQRQKAVMLRDKERRIESKERVNHQRLAQELAVLQQDAELEKADREAMRKELARYDDDYYAETGRDLFFADRLRWRSDRQRSRRIEYQEDVRDRQREVDEQAALDKEADDMLKRQMDEMADVEAKGRAAGLLFEDAKPIKVAIAAAPAQPSANAVASSSAASVKTETKPKVAPTRGVAATAFGGDEEEDDVKKKRTLVRLDDDVGKLGVTSGVEGKTQAKLIDIRNSVPTSVAEVFNFKIKWEALTPTILDEKVFPIVREKLVSILGDLEIDELFNFVVEHVQQHAKPQTIVEGLEPVLDEEAEPLVVRLWRAIAFESAAFTAGLDSGAMQV